VRDHVTRYHRIARRRATHRDHDNVVFCDRRLRTRREPLGFVFIAERRVKQFDRDCLSFVLFAQPIEQ
jgi:hypothetical protein